MIPMSIKPPRKNAKYIADREVFTEHLLSAVESLAAPVKATLGPDGLSILIERSKDNPILTKDGVTVADSINLSDPIENVIAQTIKEAAKKTNEAVGDGTTSAIVLTEAILKAGFKQINAGMVSPQKLVREIKEHIPVILDFLNKNARPISKEDEIKNVAMISSNSDEMIASAVAEAVIRAGVDGLLNLEPGQSEGIEIEQTSGYQVGKGWSVHKDHASKMITNKIRQDIMFDCGPEVLLYDGELNDTAIFLNIVNAFNGLDQVAQIAHTPGQLVIVAHSFSGGVRQLVAEMMNANTLSVMLVETEQMGSPSTMVLMLDDLAAYLSGKVIRSGHLGEIYNTQVLNGPITMVPGILGKCTSVCQSKSSTVFNNEEPNQDLLQDQILVIKKQIDDSKSMWDKNIHRRRLARLVDGMVAVKVGGRTNLEMVERKDRVEDALNATRAAQKEGIVLGGGMALFRAVESLGAKDIGATVLKEALVVPLTQIINNCGENPDFVIKTLERSGKLAGYDALKLEIIDDMFANGIIDPLLVVKTSLLNAVSISCELLKGGGFSIFIKEPAGATTNPFAGMLADENLEGIEG